MHICYVIAYIDAVALFDSSTKAKPVSVKYVDCNRSKQTGGNLIAVDKAYKCGLPYSCKDNEMRGLINVETNKKVGLHLRLILEINGQEVFYS